MVEGTYSLPPVFWNQSMSEVTVEAATLVQGDPTLGQEWAPNPGWVNHFLCRVRIQSGCWTSVVVMIFISPASISTVLVAVPFG